MRKTYYRHDEQESLLKSELSEFVADLGKGETLATYLLRLMDEKGLSSPQVYHRAELDRQIFNRLIQLRQPCRASKQTLLQVSIGILATEKEAEKLLATCGFIFELTNDNDRAFLFCLRKGEYDMVAVWEVKEMLDREVGNNKSM